MESEKTPNAIEDYKRKRLEAYAYTSGFTLAMVLVLGGIGYLLDLKFGTGHRYLFIGIIVSYPLTQYYLYRKFKPRNRAAISKKKRSDIIRTPYPKK